MHEAIQNGPHAGGSTGWAERVIRIADICVAMGLVLLFLPVMAFVAVAAYRPRAPLILRRQCMTPHGEPTVVFEFNAGSNEDQGKSQAHGDSRPSLPPVVRMFRGDQLPQLFNVIRGELSFFKSGSRPRLFAD